jgi:hypothetical protein
VILSCVRTPSTLDLTLDLPEGQTLQAHHWPIVWGYFFGILHKVPPVLPTSWVLIPPDLPPHLVEREGEGVWVLSAETLRVYPRVAPFFTALGVEHLRVRVRATAARELP